MAEPSAAPHCEGTRHRTATGPHSPQRDPTSTDGTPPHRTSPRRHPNLSQIRVLDHNVVGQNVETKWIQPSNRICVATDAPAPSSALVPSVPGSLCNIRGVLDGTSNANFAVYSMAQALCASPPTAVHAASRDAACDAAALSPSCTRAHARTLSPLLGLVPHPWAHARTLSPLSLLGLVSHPWAGMTRTATVASPSKSSSTALGSSTAAAAAARPLLAGARHIHTPHATRRHTPAWGEWHSLSIRHTGRFTLAAAARSRAGVRTWHTKSSRRWTRPSTTGST
jgi:hypothetical protein